MRVPTVRWKVVTAVEATAVASVVLASGVLPAAPARAAATAAAATSTVGRGIEPLDTNGAPVPKLSWSSCPEDVVDEALQAFPPRLRGEAYECATAEVPLSYRRPNGQSIQVAVGRLPAADQQHKIGALFYNPGGPGGSGRIPPKLSPALHQRFDIVGFDPRGTNASTPVQCFTSPRQAIRAFGWPFPITPAQERKVVAVTKRGTQLCAENAGPLLAHMSTANVARDMDLLRQAVGDQQLTYLGYSYGTHLGEVYANLFPDRVRAVVLDAVLNPIEWTTGRQPDDAFKPFTYRIGSFRGAEKALQAFLTACADDQRCAFREPNADAKDLKAKYNTLLDRLRDQPVTITTPGGSTEQVTYQDVVSLTLGSLYDASTSPALARMLQQLYNATSPSARTTAGPRRVNLPEVPTHPRYTPLPAAAPYPGLEWFNAVGCLDSSNPGNPYTVGRYARKADAQARGFGPVWTYRSLPCATWPAVDPDRYTGPWNRDTASPILTIGNRQGDPATPYPDARSTTALLADARLLALDSFGHTAAYLLGDSSCINQHVNRYLLTQKLPPKGTVCQPDREPFDPGARADTYSH